ncbi:MAG: riboflavin synthase [Bacillota bacterium]
MFTGIVAETGQLKKIFASTDKYQLEISANKVLNNLKKGHSIAVNGVCLTVVDYTSSSFKADVMPGTLEATNLSNLQKGDKVNLEQAVQANSFMGGHLVTGHIDDTGEVVDIRKENNAKLVEIEISSDLMKYMIDKGSVAINGVSLTIYKIKDNSIIVSLIPETWSETNLQYLKRGSEVNIEADIIGKYVAKLLGKKSKTNNLNQNQNKGIDKNFLANNGFL